LELKVKGIELAVLEDVELLAGEDELLLILDELDLGLEELTEEDEDVGTEDATLLEETDGLLSLLLWLLPPQPTKTTTRNTAKRKCFIIQTLNSLFGACSLKTSDQ
jgi:hypothetical protein